LLHFDHLFRHGPKPVGVAWIERIACNRSDGLLAALIVGVDLVLLPIDIGLPAVGEAASLVANGLLLGREYFELVALRHMELERVSQLQRNNRTAVWLAGTLIALSSMVPVVNLVGPLLGTSLMVHLFHRISSN
jgi:CysZ protein